MTMFEHYYILYTKKEPKIDKTKTSIIFSETRYRYAKIDTTDINIFWNNFCKTESLKTIKRKKLTFIEKLDRLVSKICFPLIAVAYSFMIFYGVYVENNLLVIWAGLLSFCFSIFFSSFFKISVIQPIKNCIYKKMLFNCKVMSILVLAISIFSSFILLIIYQNFFINTPHILFKLNNIGNTATLISLIVFFVDKSIEYNQLFED